MSSASDNSHGKLSAAHTKVFGRWSRLGLGIINPKKSLHSLRHRYKDILQDVRLPTRIAKRPMGHTSGDVQVHDSYGSGIPLEQLFEYIKSVGSPGTLALPWQPNLGFVTSPSAKAIT